MHRPKKVQKSLSNGPEEWQVYRREPFDYTCSILGENHKKLCLSHFPPYTINMIDLRWFTDPNMKPKTISLLNIYI